eukprot:6430655-Alexandrium_andersonii.AAC.1
MCLGLDEESNPIRKQLGLLRLCTLAVSLQMNTRLLSGQKASLRADISTKSLGRHPRVWQLRILRVMAPEGRVRVGVPRPRRMQLAAGLLLR